RRAPLARGEGLPGRVWAGGGPAWVEDVARDASFLRAPPALGAGLRGACALPIRLAGEVVGVLEFFSRATRPEDPGLLRALAGVANQVGQSLERRRAEEALREKSEQWRVTLASIGDAVVVTDAAGR